MADDKIRASLIAAVARDVMSVPYDFWSGQQYPIQWGELFHGEEFAVEIETEEVFAESRTLSVNARRLYEWVSFPQRLTLRNDQSITKESDSVSRRANRLALRALMEEIRTQVKPYRLNDLQNLGLPLSKTLSIGDANVLLTMEVSETLEDGVCIDVKISDAENNAPVLLENFFVDA